MRQSLLDTNRFCFDSVPEFVAQLSVSHEMDWLVEQIFKVMQGPEVLLGVKRSLESGQYVDVTVKRRFITRSGTIQR